jgi:hypothetical protein
LGGFGDDVVVVDLARPAEKAGIKDRVAARKMDVRRRIL